MDKSEHKTLSDFANITIPKEFYENDAEIILLHAELSGGSIRFYIIEKFLLPLALYPMRRKNTEDLR